MEKKLSQSHTESMAERIVSDALNMEQGGSSAAPETALDIMAAILSCRIDMTREITPPNFLLNYDGVSFCPFGTLSVISGRAKQGKTQFANIMCSIILGGTSFGQMRRCYDPIGSYEGGNVLWIDTEQSTYNVQRNVKRLQHMGGFPDGDTARWGLNVYSTLPYSPEQRLQLINAAIELHRPQVLVIDGIRDLIHNPNDEQESYGIVEWLQALVADGRMSVFVIIHENQSDGKMRGHLGTELLNKVSDRFRVTKNDAGYFACVHESRNEVIPKFTFHFDMNGDLQPWAADAPTKKGK